MDGLRKKEIRDRAEAITKGSEQFQLIHATYAARAMIKAMVVNFYKEKYDLLLKRISEKMELGKDIDKELQEKKELEARTKQSRFHIDVEYIETNSEDMARVVKVENAFVINLPKSLAEQIFDKNGDYNYRIIQKIRSLMAHELGHLILHTDELIRIEGTQGSRELSSEEYEAEATYFGNELIELRRQRNEKFYRDKAYKSF